MTKYMQTTIYLHDKGARENKMIGNFIKIVNNKSLISEKPSLVILTIL